ncbi:uncharacterized protein EAF02_009955 [Botrytis sinoallii]|uniref:uncharacterized protein n=1 Tax=Botrytis sinoallii TaxID=1463999 RepID=UPI0018FF2E5C|nr:uncharacterized protein EAF02_009955 [Botrytis sinoallii]KAF7865532.1 hypothetical protein EAF02_009955 [Botrytis sinoallii]
MDFNKTAVSTSGLSIGTLRASSAFERLYSFLVPLPKEILIYNKHNIHSIHTTTEKSLPTHLYYNPKTNAKFSRPYHALFIMMKFLLLFLFAATILAQCPEQSEAGRRLYRCVNTTSGQVAGHPSPKKPAVYEYLGIPFAQPPIGDLRFAPPQPFTGNESLNGTNFGYTCPKLFSDELSLIPSNFPDVVDNYTASGISILDTFTQAGDGPRNNEDCLTLNVWVPKPAQAPVVGTKKAVMIWIYGGAFRDGATESHIYDGSTLVDQEDVIMVSINYRVNIFGFSGDSTGPTSNYGMLDQRLAIEWVYNNIANFGGDPSRITLFGQSAGSCSIDYYSYAHPQDPIVSAMIMQSGTIPSLPTFSSSEAFSSWRNTSSSLGCGDASVDPDSVIQCMRNPNLTTAAILQIAHLYTFLPSIDESLVFSDYPARAAAGNLTTLPLLIGNTNNEAAVFAAQSLMSGHPIDIPQMTNSTFACPTAARANVSTAAGAKTWRYRYFGDFPNLQILKGVDAGAFHITDVYSVFGTWPTGPGITGAGKEQVLLGRYMRGAWAAFAKDSEQGLSDYGWPVYKPEEETVVRLGWKNSVGLVLDRAKVWDSTC